MDECDFASEQEEKWRKASIERCLGIKIHIDGCGECLWCGDAVEVGRWCSNECRDDWVRYS